jgi:hypothetical protein
LTIGLAFAFQFMWFKCLSSSPSSSAFLSNIDFTAWAYLSRDFKAEWFLERAGVAS